MNAFRRRTYSGLDFVHDIFGVLRNPGLAVGVLWGLSIPPRLRERLYLAVIAVNRCRYCTYLHTRSALHSGLSQDDVKGLLAGIVDDVPVDEARAILYAQHWADNQGRADPQAQADLVAAYGDKRSRAIGMVLLLIQIGSLSGNSLDYLLFRVSRGRWGWTKEDR